MAFRFFYLSPYMRTECLMKKVQMLQNKITISKIINDKLTFLKVFRRIHNFTSEDYNALSVFTQIRPQKCFM